MLRLRSRAVGFRHTNEEFDNTALDWLRAEHRVVRGLLVGIEGSAPFETGAAMLIRDDGRIEGSVTGGCVEAALVHEAEAVFARSEAGRVFTYGVSDELAGSVGLTCGGTVHVFLHELTEAAAEAQANARSRARRGVRAAVATLLDGAAAGATMTLIDGAVDGSLNGTDLLDRNVARDLDGPALDGEIRAYGADGSTLGDDLRVYIQAFGAPPQMLLVGAIDYAAAVAALADEIGYQVTICDARRSFASSPRFARHAEVVVDWPQRVIAARDLGPDDAVIVLTHDPKFDEPALAAAVRGGAGYIGALGSRKTVADRTGRLIANGLTADEIDRIHMPCGLDLGARTPHETAISIIAEIIGGRNGRRGLSLRDADAPIHEPREVRV
jgi:xanthine dehydrogenase accessory factor